MMMRRLFAWILFSLATALLADAQDFRKTFLRNSWIDEAGFRGHVFPADTFNVMNFGVRNDGIFLTTEPLQRVIDACASAGGGVVYLPEGRYLTGSIFLRSNVHLLLDSNAIVLGSMELKDYAYRETRVNGTEMVGPMAVINIVDAENAGISGKGTIHGQGKPFWAKFWYMEKIYLENGVRWAAVSDCERPRTLLVQNSSNVLISEVTIREAAFWTIHILYSKYVTVDGVTIRNNDEGQHGPSTDGIDIDSSEHILVENCDIDCNDDNFCLKAGRDADGLRVNRPTRYIVLRNNTARAGAGLITFGSETSGGISHVYAHNMKSDGTRNGIRFKSAAVRGGYISDILLEEFDLRNTGFVFAVEMNFNPAASYPKLPEKYHPDEIPGHWKILLQKVEPPERGLCKVDRIYLRNITALNCRTAFKVEGFEDLPVRGFHFENVNVQTKSAGTIKHAKTWKAKGSRFVYDDGGRPMLTNGVDIAFEIMK